MEPVWRDVDLFDDVAVGQWIAEALGTYSKYAVGSLVPRRFEEYARVLYPAQASYDDADETPARWSDVARVSGAVAHAGMQWAHIAASEPPSRRNWAYGPGSIASLPLAQIESLAGALSPHTTTPDDCFYAFWEGNTAFDGIRAGTPKLVIGQFRYYVLHGPAARAGHRFRGLRPHLWWPADHAWCVATHFDFDCAYLGATSECIDDLLRHPVLETWATVASQPVTGDSDHLNITR